MKRIIVTFVFCFISYFVQAADKPTDTFVHFNHKRRLGHATIGDLNAYYKTRCVMRFLISRKRGEQSPQ